MTEPTAVWPLSATLGEGPVWVTRDAALWFVDIKGCKIHRFDPANGDKRSWDAPAPVGWVLPTSGGGMLAGLKTGLHRFSAEDGSFERLIDPEPELPNNRLNDATVGPDGRLWFGTMDDAEEADSGAIYALNRDGGVTVAGGRCCITNGPALSPDGRIIYLTDTLARTIDAADVAADGTISNVRRFATIAAEDGYPDGPTVDSEGHVWTGLWGGWRARRYSPAGEIVAEVRLPVANVTKIALGGEDLKTAYATTARKGLTHAELQQQPLAGALFSFRVDVPGQQGAEISIGL